MASGPIPSLTKTFHHETYPSINPLLRPELSLQGKKIVITGGGAGIGRALCRGFADAGAQRIAILGRREDKLLETKREIEGERNKKNAFINVIVYVVDVTDIERVRTVAKEIEGWDVLVSNAGYMPTLAHVVDSEPEDWWRCFEVNVKGLFNIAHTFLPNRNPGAVLIGINTRTLQLEGMSKRFSAYNSSKIAALKVLHTLADENEDLYVVAMHPGVIQTEMSEKVENDTGAKYQKFDEPELPGHMAVWLCSEEAKFLRAKFIWCNWDIDELKDKKDEIEGSPLLTVNCVGWPYSA